MTRSAVSVRSSSRATVGTDLPLSRTSRTASALNSFVNARRFRLAMTHSYRTFVRSEVSTKPGQVHPSLVVFTARLLVHRLTVNSRPCAEQSPSSP